MPFFRVNFSDTQTTNGRNNISGFNNFTDPSVAGLLTSDLLEPDLASTGYSLTLNNSMSTSGGSSTAVSAPNADFPLEWYQGWWFQSSDVSFDVGGLPEGATYVLRIAGQNGNERDTQFSATNGDGPVTYVDNNATDPVEAAVTITGTVPAGGVVRIDATVLNFFLYVNGFDMDVQVASSNPTITDINTNNEVIPGETATLNGTNLTGSTGFNIGSESQTDFTVVSDTSITFTTVRGGNPYNQDLTGTLLHPDGNQTITVQQVPESGTFAVTAASPNTTDDASLWTGLIDTATSDPITIVDGDQAWVKNPNNLTNLAIQPDGTITADETGDFVVQIWLASEGVWGSDQTVTFEVPDDVAPVFSVAPAVAATNTTGHTISATIDEGGTLYGVRLADGSTAPSSAQVKAGQDAAGAAAPEAKSVAATASTSADLVFSTASSDTPYDYYVVAEDDASTPNIQASPTLVEATTSIEPPPASVPGSGRRGFLRPAVRGTVDSIIGSIIS